MMNLTAEQQKEFLQRLERKLLNNGFGKYPVQSILDLTKDVLNGIGENGSNDKTHLLEKSKITLEELKQIEELEGVDIEHNGNSGLHIGYQWYSAYTEDSTYNLYVK